MQATSSFRISPMALAAHRSRMRTLALSLVVISTAVAVGAPLLSTALGVFVPVAIAAWVVAVPMWRRARPDARARLVTFEGRTVREEGGDDVVGPQPVLHARAFRDHLEVVAGTYTPRPALHQIELPWTPEDRERVLDTLRSEHGLAIAEAGPYGRHLALAFTIVPAVVVAAFVAYRVILLALAVGVVNVLGRLDPATAFGALLALVVGAAGWVVLRSTRPGP